MLRHNILSINAGKALKGFLTDFPKSRCTRVFHGMHGSERGTLDASLFAVSQQLIIQHLADIPLQNWAIDS